jgi:glutamate formiminotransferase
VSLNLTDHEVTPIHLAYEEVCKDAAALGVPVVGSEIVGLVPLKALLQVCGAIATMSPVGPQQILNLKAASMQLCSDNKNQTSNDTYLQTISYII